MEEFIKILTEQIRCVRAREGIAQEISNHILDQTEAFEQKGMSHEQALERAVQEMGDPVEIGLSMDQIHRPQIDWKMMLITFLLSIVGLVCMMPMFGVTYVISRQLLFTLAGFGVIAAVCLLDYSVLGRTGIAAGIVLTVAFLIGKRYYFQTINGRIPAMSILVYLYVPVFAGILYQLRKKGFKTVFLVAGIIGFTCVMALYLSSSLMVAGNLFLCMIILLVAAVIKGMFGKNKTYMTAFIAVVVTLPTIFWGWLLWSNKYSFRVQRLTAFFNRGKYQEAEGYYYKIIRDVLHSSKWVGTGNNAYFEELLFPGLKEGEFLPLTIIYYFGFIVGIVLLILLAVFILCAINIVHRQKNQLGALVSLACFLVLAVNCVEGILISVGLFPVTTAAIPFLTRGGSTALVYAVLIGLLLSVHRREKIVSYCSVVNKSSEKRASN